MPQAEAGTTEFCTEDAPAPRGDRPNAHPLQRGDPRRGARARRAPDYLLLHACEAHRFCEGPRASGEEWFPRVANRGDPGCEREKTSGVDEHFSLDDAIR